MRGSRGFSVIEVLVAMAIVSLITLVFFYVYSNAGKNLARSRYKLEAVTIARKQLESILAKDYSDSALTPGVHTLSVPLGSLTGLSTTVEYTVEDTPLEDKKITMRVRWSQP